MLNIFELVSLPSVQRTKQYLYEIIGTLRHFEKSRLYLICWKAFLTTKGPPNEYFELQRGHRFGRLRIAIS